MSMLCHGTAARACALAIAGLATAALAPAPASGGAFQLNERSTRALGTSLAGSASAASDVSFQSFNPAALTRVRGFEAGGSIAGVWPISDAEVRDGPFAGQEFDADRLGVVPSFALGYGVTDRLSVGFSSYTPFGLKTEYPEDSIVQADARTSELRTISFSPAISYEVIDGLSFGAALDILYVDVRLTSAPVNLDGKDVGVGFRAGVLWDVVPSTTLGLAYHHGYDLNPDTDTFMGLEGDAEASLPNWLQAGVTHRLTEDVRLMLEGRWINWSRFDEIVINTPGLAGTPFGRVVDEQNYDDAFYIAGGAEYDFNDQLTLRGGVAFDETPTNDTFRTPRVPDADRLWLSLGASYAMSPGMSADLSYSYLHALEDPEVTLRNGPAAGTRLDYDGGAHILSVGGSIRF